MASINAQWNKKKDAINYAHFRGGIHNEKQENIDLRLVALLSILLAFAEAESQTKPYLVKDGVKIIL